MGIIKLHKCIDLELKGGFVTKNTIKDFLSFFDIPVEDLPKVVEFSDQLKKDKFFVLKHKEQFMSLTKREQQVFKMVVEGEKSNKIAEELFIETVTVSTHRKNIKQKLDLKSTYDWYRYAKAFKILKL